MQTANHLIVGSDGLIGSALTKALAAKSANVWQTTRRNAFVTTPRIAYLDLQNPSHFQIPVKPDVAFLCGGQSNFLECERNTETTYAINVEGTVTIAKKLLDAGTFVIFLSSSAVFNGHTPWPDESATLSPTTAYGAQKSDAEKRLLTLDRGKGRVAIVRLTKILTQRMPLIQRFLSDILNKKTFYAFSDLRMSPISLHYVIDALCLIAERQIGGIFHLSGDAELSYVDFARQLAAHLNEPKSLIKENSLVNATSPILFTPQYPGLGMSTTINTLQIKPEPIATVLSYLVDASEVVLL